MDFDPHVGRPEVAESTIFTKVFLHFRYFRTSPLGRHLGPILAPFLAPKTAQVEAKMEPSWPQEWSRTAPKRPRTAQERQETQKDRPMTHLELSWGRPEGHVEATWAPCRPPRGYQDEFLASQKGACWKVYLGLLSGPF